MEQACRNQSTNSAVVTINIMIVEEQGGGNDCGLFAIAMAYDLCSNIDPINKVYNQPQMRDHLYSCFSE